MSFDLGGIVGPLVGLAVAGYAVKAIGDSFHGTCHHCGHTIEAKDHNTFKAKAAEHSKTHGTHHHTNVLDW